MPVRREDYILRLIEELREFVARLINLRDANRLDEALMAAVAAQEKLFARPAAEFMGLALDDQLSLLRAGEAADTARQKCLAYASILEEAGRVYEARGRGDLAAGALGAAASIRAGEGTSG